MPRLKSHKGAQERRDQLIQFRADDLLFRQLSVVADRLRTPIGVLARQWVAERLAQEIRKDKDSMEAWLSQRWDHIQRKLKTEMEAGPVQVLHVVPYSTAINIDPESVRGVMSLLSPVERIEARYSGRINLEGFITEKVFKDSTKVNGYIQVFRSGQVESVRILHEDESGKALYGDQLDSDLITSVWAYTTALQQLSVPLPLLLTCEFHAVKGYTLRTRNYAGPTCQFEHNDFSLPSLTVSDWSQTERIESVADLLRPSLDVLWNAAGFERSSSYQANGTWRGPLNPW